MERRKLLGSAAALVLVSCAPKIEVKPSAPISHDTSTWEEFSLPRIDQTAVLRNPEILQVPSIGIKDLYLILHSDSPIVSVFCAWDPEAQNQIVPGANSAGVGFQEINSPFIPDAKKVLVFSPSNIPDPAKLQQRYVNDIGRILREQGRPPLNIRPYRLTVVPRPESENEHALIFGGGFFDYAGIKREPSPISFIKLKFRFL